jgi:hypothetical protein
MYLKHVDFFALGTFVIGFPVVVSSVVVLRTYLAIINLIISQGNSAILTLRTLMGSTHLKN